jgi:hypothetical protein
MTTLRILMFFLTIFSTYNLTSIPIIEKKVSAEHISSSEVIDEIERLDKLTNYLDLNNCRLNFLQDGYSDSEWTRFCFSLISLEKLRELNLNNNNLWELNPDNLRILQNAIFELSRKNLRVVRMLNNTNKCENYEEFDNYPNTQYILTREEFASEKNMEANRSKAC